MNDLVRWLRRSLSKPAGGDENAEVPTRRRILVVAVTLVAGTVLLGFLLRVEPGDAWFYPLGLAQAAVWAAGGLGSGPLPLVRTAADRWHCVVDGLIIGIALGTVFVLGAFVIRQVDALQDAVIDLLHYADGTALVAATIIAVANGVGEEMFFRGAVYAAANNRRPVLVSTLVYTATTVATGNLMLVFAAATVGLVLAWQRRATDGVLAPLVTHVTWSLMMLFTLRLILPT